jgi:2-polyprenyl-3-methyl-5-hydroxy-6-metoxy-1,4-benzoquinol methylase
VILDAACGTGKYWPLILSSGRSVLGMDQAQEMLNRAHAKSPDVPIRKQGLQELADLGDYEGIVCIDAMEYIPPEDWPVVLRNFHQALKPGGLLYLTVELPVEEEARAAFETAVNMGLPVVTGESAHEDGYHYYPSIAQVRDWIGRADFRVLEEVVGDDYHHFLIRR